MFYTGMLYSKNVIFSRIAQIVSIYYMVSSKLYFQHVDTTDIYAIFTYEDTIVIKIYYFLSIYAKSNTRYV